MPKGFRAIRRQSDSLGDSMSEATGLDLSGEVDLARQEYKDEADINKLLSRYGVGVPQRQIVYGEQDFDLDLQRSLRAIQDAKEAHAHLRPDLRQKYRNWAELLNAAASGELQTDLKEPAAPPPAPPPIGEKPIADPA